MLETPSLSEQLVKSPLEWIDLTIKVLPYLGALALMVYVMLRTNAMFYVVYRWHQLLGATKGFNSKFAQRVWADHVLKFARYAACMLRAEAAERRPLAHLINPPNIASSYVSARRILHDCMQSEFGWHQRVKAAPQSTLRQSQPR